MKCSKCGFNNADDLNFCVQCGFSLKETDQRNIEPQPNPTTYDPVNLGYDNSNRPLKPSGLLWFVILAYGFMGLTSFYVLIAPSSSGNSSTSLLTLMIGILMLITAFQLMKLNEVFKSIAIGIAFYFGLLQLTGFNAFIFIMVLYTLYVLILDKQSVFLFKEQTRRKIALSTTNQ